MSELDEFAASGPAELRYEDGDFRVVRPGAFVVCAVTAKPIALRSLKYWSVDRQEAYVDAAAAMIGFGYGERT